MAGPKVIVRVFDASGDGREHVFQLTALVDPQSVVYILRKYIPRMMVVERKKGEGKPARGKAGKGKAAKAPEGVANA